MTTQKSNLFCSKEVGRMIVQGMEEVMGEALVHTVFDRAALSGQSASWQSEYAPDLPYHSISKLQKALEDIFGDRSGHGLALRSGRASFRYGLHWFGEQAGWNSLDFRLMPPRLKVREGARTLIDGLNQLCSGSSHIEEDEKTYRWVVGHCPVCWERQSQTPVCHLGVGFLQEFLSWASGGKFFQVVETECAASGAPACVFVINKLVAE